MQRLNRILSVVMLFSMIFSITPISLAEEPNIDEVHDVDKYYFTAPDLYPYPRRDTVDRDDYNMCWAASAANIITATGWAIERRELGESGPLEYHVYHDLLSGFPNEGGWLRTAVEAYFSWYYPDIDYRDFYISVGEDDIVDSFDDDIDEGYKLQLGIWFTTGSGSLLGGHAITCWDYDTINDEDGDEDNLIEYYKAYVTDSDDYNYIQNGYLENIHDYYNLKELKNTTIEFVTIPDIDSNIEGLYAYGGKIKSYEGLQTKPLYLREYYLNLDGLAVIYNQVSPWREGDETKGDIITHGGERYYYKDSAQQGFKLNVVPELERVDSTDPSQKLYKYNEVEIYDYEINSWYLGNQPIGEKIIWENKEYFYDIQSDLGFELEPATPIIEKIYRNQTDISASPIDYNVMIARHQQEFDTPPIHPNKVFANNDKFYTDEDTVLTIDVSSGLLGNDILKQDQPYLSEIDVEPNHGTVTLSTDGSFIYTPDVNYYGTDFFSYKLVDVLAGNTEVNSATVFIQINPVNDPPEINIDKNFYGYEGSSVTFNGDATDVEGDTINYFWYFDDDPGLDATGTNAVFTWYDDFDGFITFQAVDSKGAGSIETPSVNIINIEPVVNAGLDYEIYSGESLSFSGSITDPGDDTYTIEWYFDDGSYSYNTLTPIHTFFEPKIHNVKLSVEDDDGGIGVDYLEVLVKPIDLSIDVHPPILNSKSNGNWITCYIELPETYDVNDIIIDTIEMNNIGAEISPIDIGDQDDDGIIDMMVKFDRSALIQFPILGIFELELHCENYDGVQFIGYDSLLII